MLSFAHEQYLHIVSPPKVSQTEQGLATCTTGRIGGRGSRLAVDTAGCKLAA